MKKKNAWKSFPGCCVVVLLLKKEWDAGKSCFCTKEFVPVESAWVIHYPAPKLIGLPPPRGVVPRRKNILQNNWSYQRIVATRATHGSTVLPLRCCLSPSLFLSVSSPSHSLSLSLSLFPKLGQCETRHDQVFLLQYRLGNSLFTQANTIRLSSGCQSLS